VLSRFGRGVVFGRPSRSEIKHRVRRTGKKVIPRGAHLFSHGLNIGVGDGGDGAALTQNDILVLQSRGDRVPNMEAWYKPHRAGTIQFIGNLRQPFRSSARNTQYYCSADKSMLKSWIRYGQQPLRFFYDISGSLNLRYCQLHLLFAALSRDPHFVLKYMPVQTPASLRRTIIVKVTVA